MGTYIMDGFTIVGERGRMFDISVRETRSTDPDVVKSMIEVDLQTFSEATYSSYTASCFLQVGRVFLMYANERVIGTCVVIRSFDEADEALVISMGIRPGWRCKGLGQRFLDAVIDMLRGSVSAVALIVGSNNRRALKLYDDVGFKVVAEGHQDTRSGETLLKLRRDLVSSETPQDAQRTDAA